MLEKMNFIPTIEMFILCIPLRSLRHPVRAQCSVSFSKPRKQCGCKSAIRHQRLLPFDRFSLCFFFISQSSVMEYGFSFRMRRQRNSLPVSINVWTATSTANIWIVSNWTHETLPVRLYFFLSLCFVAENWELWIISWKLITKTKMLDSFFSSSHFLLNQPLRIRVRWREKKTNIFRIWSIWDAKVKKK